MPLRARTLFEQTFGREPLVVTSAPGRVNLIGEHTDYNGGQVLPIAIRQRTFVAMAPAQGSGSRAVSANYDTAGAFAIAAAGPSGSWWDYIHGSLREIAALGVAVPEVDVAVTSDVPVGAGLSSSAALEVASVLAGLVSARGRLMERWSDVALAAHRAETQFVGVSCGVMDQMASAYAGEGHALRIWCDTNRHEPVRCDLAILIVDTATPRELRRSAYNVRREECRAALDHLRRTDPALEHLAHASPAAVEESGLTGTLLRRARHVTQETRRVGQFVESLAWGKPLGTLLAASHESLRDDYECSSPELDWVVEHASARTGIEGARLTGAGWGGCAIVVGTPDALASLGAELPPAFEATWGRSPRTWVTRAEAGLDVEWAAGMEDE